MEKKNQPIYLCKQVLKAKKIDNYFIPQKQALGFPKVEYKPLLKGKLTKVNKPTLWNEKTKHKRLT